MLEQGITALLSADSGLAALIAGRVYPVTPPEAPVYPCITYLVVSSKPDYALDGSQCGYKRLQFDVWSDSYAECKAVLNALRNALDGYRGTLSEGTRVLCAFRGMEIDNFENNSRAYRSLTEYELTFVEP
jgi:hypothetical protein